MKDINRYDLIVIGNSIRIGMIDKKIKKFLISNMETLKSKKQHILFVVALMKIGKVIMNEIFQKICQIMQLFMTLLEEKWIYKNKKVLTNLLQRW